MDPLDERILRCYFRMEEYLTQRLRFERLLHPEKFKWAKGVPKLSTTKQVKLEELERMGFGEDFYQRMGRGEEDEKKELEELAELHLLWPHVEPIGGFGALTCGKFIAAAGDIRRPGTNSAFWKGMGLDIVDGKAPRRIRGGKDVERKMPAYPHVTRVGEQIRKQMLMQNACYQELYSIHKADYRVRYPDKPLMFAHKHGLRIAQKVLYSCLFERWRECIGQPAPEPYVYAILKHDSGRKITLEDFYKEKPRMKQDRQAARVSG